MTTSFGPNRNRDYWQILDFLKRHRELELEAREIKYRNHTNSFLMCAIRQHLASEWQVYVKAKNYDNLESGQSGWRIENMPPKPSPRFTVVKSEYQGTAE